MRACRADIAFVDAPVSGSRSPAENGQLHVLASGPETVAHQLEPIFGAIGRRTLWLGPAGNDTRMKLVLNTWLAFEVEAAAEGAALAARFGISAEALASAVDGNPLASALAAGKLSKIQSGDDRAQFSLAWALKDLDLMHAVDETNAAPVAATIASRWHTLVGSGLGDLDVSAARHGLADDRPNEPVKDPAPTPVHGAATGQPHEVAVTEWADVS